MILVRQPDTMYNLDPVIAAIPLSQYREQYRDVERFLGFCQSCRQYEKCWACPPFDFSPDEFMDAYTHAYIIGTRILPSQEQIAKCTDAEKSKAGMSDMIYKVRRKLDAGLLAVEREVRGSRAFYAGTCHLCAEGTCTRITGNPCRFPMKVRYSLEAFGFDMGKTTQELLGIELKWSVDGKLPEYLTLVSGLLTKEKVEGLEERLLHLL